jgi:hypothetical protein
MIMRIGFAGYGACADAKPATVNSNIDTRMRESMFPLRVGLWMPGTAVRRLLLCAVWRFAQTRGVSGDEASAATMSAARRMYLIKM